MTVETHFTYEILSELFNIMFSSGTIKRLVLKLVTYKARDRIVASLKEILKIYPDLPRDPAKKITYDSIVRTIPMDIRGLLSL